MATVTGSTTAVSFLAAASGETNESSSDGAFVAMTTPVTQISFGAPMHADSPWFPCSRNRTMYLSARLSARASAHVRALVRHHGINGMQQQSGMRSKNAGVNR